MNSPGFVPPALTAPQATRILAQRQNVRYWRRAFFLHPLAFILAPLIIHSQYWQIVWSIACSAAIVSAFTSYKKWVREHRRFKVVVAEEILGPIIEQKIPAHTFSPFRQLSRDWLKISHLVEDEYAYPGVDENLIYKIFSGGNIEVFHTDLTGQFGLHTNRFRGAFASYTAKSTRVKPRDFIVNFGEHSRSMPLFDVPGNTRIFEFRKHVRDVPETDPDYEMLKRIEELRKEISEVIDLKLLQVVVEGRFILISVWSDEIFFDLPTDIKIDSKEIYKEWRRYIRIYQLLVRFLQRNFVPAKEHSEIHWY